MTFTSPQLFTVLLRIHLTFWQKLALGHITLFDWYYTTGIISFTSNGWGGRVSDKYIVELSGFKQASPGDVILADRGFHIHVSDSVTLKGATLDLPAFT